MHPIARVMQLMTHMNVGALLGVGAWWLSQQAWLPGWLP